MPDYTLLAAPRRHDRLSVARGAAIIAICIFIVSVGLMLLPAA